METGLTAEWRWISSKFVPKKNYGLLGALRAWRPTIASNVQRAQRFYTFTELPAQRLRRTARTHPPITSSIHGRIATWKRDTGKTMGRAGRQKCLHSRRARDHWGQLLPGKGKDEEGRLFHGTSHFLIRIDILALYFRNIKKCNGVVLFLLFHCNKTFIVILASKTAPRHWLPPESWPLILHGPLDIEFASFLSLYDY